MRDAKSTSNPEGIARRCRLPNNEFEPAWTAIKVADGMRERLLAQSLLSYHQAAAAVRIGTAARPDSPDRQTRDG